MYGVDIEDMELEILVSSERVEFVWPEWEDVGVEIYWSDSVVEVKDDLDDQDNIYRR